MPEEKKKPRGFLRFVLALAVVTAFCALCWPLTLGPELRARGSSLRLKNDWIPEYRVIPLLSLSWARVEAGDRKTVVSLLDQAWRELAGFKGGHAEFFWISLSRLEHEAGRDQKARMALKKARALDPTIISIVRGPDYTNYRHAMGLDK